MMREGALRIPRLSYGLTLPLGIILANIGGSLMPSLMPVLLRRGIQVTIQNTGSHPSWKVVRSSPKQWAARLSAGTMLTIPVGSHLIR